MARAELFDDWTKTEKQLFAANTALITLDYATTYNLLYQQENFREINPLLGEHPSKEKLVLFALSKIALSYVLVDRLNHDKRKKLLITFTAINLIGPVNNFTLGARIQF